MKIKLLIKIYPLLITIILFTLFISGLEYKNKLNNEKQYKNKLSDINYGTRRGIDPTPLPPEPPPNL